MPKGLINLNNICYLNSLIQCLISISLFNETILEKEEFFDLLESL